ncbi:hydrogenase maturation protease [Methanoculleus sp. FWC-SCC1]|uniref:Hydrogenase maturation protease n=1 Tax=Methanoculleus frigidifontis TaxID=2584085 RepID=A0ABT8M6F9_9EURY|nr:hydrogenase maturation protease [Methanoculleus sp. FWC-SCC1]MDN7023495.1 hydrogenase maturation protease [Methanoculleus sp. FWC-SCC1]
MNTATDPHKRVIACGNPFMGNDGAGIAVLNLLHENNPDIDAVDAGVGGLGLIPLMEECTKVVVVDAMVGIGNRIGDVRIFRGNPPARGGTLALHEIDLGDVIAVARELGIPTEVVTVGIEVGSVEEYSDRLDPAVEEGVRAAYACVLREMKE